MSKGVERKLEAEPTVYKITDLRTGEIIGYVKAWNDKSARIQAHQRYGHTVGIERL